MAYSQGYAQIGGPSMSGGYGENSTLLTREEKIRKAPQVGDRVQAIQPIQDGLVRVNIGEFGRVTRRLNTRDGQEDIEFRWDSGATTTTPILLWNEYVKFAASAGGFAGMGGMAGGGMGGMAGGGMAGGMLSAFMMQPQILESVKAIETIRDGSTVIIIGDIGKVEEIEERYGTQHLRIRWKDRRVTSFPMSEWRQWVKKVDMHELDMEEKIKRPYPCAVFGGFALQLFVVGIVVWYFGPKDFDEEKVKKLTLWGILPLASLVPWVLSCTKDKKATIPGLVSLVAVCMVAGLLTLTHCFIFPRDQHLTSLAAIPKELMNATSHASTNALVCWTDNARVSTLNNFLTAETEQSTGVKVKTASGIAFSSMVSPMVPLAVGAIYYFMWIGDFDVFWFAPMRSKTVALDIVDCIVMWDTIFAHDPYFAFEADEIGGMFAIVFVLTVGAWWIIATLQLRYEFQEIRYSGVLGVLDDTHKWRFMSIGLNLSFFALRMFLRFKAQYCAPAFLVKNLTVFIPLFFQTNRPKRGDEGGSLYGRVHSLTAECRDYRNALEAVMRFAKKSLDDDRRKWEYQLQNRNRGMSGGLSSSMHGDRANSRQYELDRIIESRQKLTGSQGYMAPGGQLLNRISQALDFANQKNDLASRRGSIVSPEELKAKFRSHVESIQSEVNCVKTETEIIFQKLEKNRAENQGGGGMGGGGGGGDDSAHIEVLHGSLNSIKEEVLRILELHHDKDYRLGEQGNYSNSVSPSLGNDYMGSHPLSPSARQNLQNAGW